MATIIVQDVILHAHIITVRNRSRKNLYESSIKNQEILTGTISAMVLVTSQQTFSIRN